MTDKDDALLTQQCIKKNNDGMCKGTRGGQMRMVLSKRLRRGRVRRAKSLDKFDDRKIADSLERQGSGYLDGDWDLVVMHDSIVLMSVSWQTISLTRQLLLELFVFRLVFGLVLLDTSVDHGLELLDEQVLDIRSLQDISLLEG